MFTYGIFKVLKGEHEDGPGARDDVGPCVGSCVDGAQPVPTFFGTFQSLLMEWPQEWGWGAVAESTFGESSC